MSLRHRAFGAFRPFSAERHKRRGGAGLFAPSMVSRSAEYPVPMRSWIELGRKNNMEVTFPAKSEGPSRTTPGHSPRAYTHLDAGPGQKFTQFFAFCAGKRLDASAENFIPGQIKLIFGSVRSSETRKGGCH